MVYYQRCWAVLAVLVWSGWSGAADAQRGAEVVIFEPLAAVAPSGNNGLFMGVNQFTDDSLSSLQFAVHDAIELAYLFVNELKLVPAKSCYLLLSGKPEAKTVQDHLDELRRQGATVRGATRSEILDSFLEVCDRGGAPSDLLVTSFSSHGFEEGPAAFIMPSDGRRRLLAETGVPLDKIEHLMQNSKAGHRLLLVDACQERVSARNIGRDRAGKPMSAAYLDAFKKPTGQAKLASCSPGEFSYEHPSLGGVGHGVFSHAILEGLRGEAPADSQNLVRFGSVTDFVVHWVTQWSRSRGRQQTPWVSAAGTTRELALALRAGDVASLTVAVRRLALSPSFDASLRTRLADRLSYADLAREADRVLVSRAREFVHGTLKEDLVVPYLRNVLPPPLVVAPFDSAVARAQQESWAKHLGQPVELTNSIGMKLTLIPLGEFVMGSTESAEEIHRRVPGGKAEWYTAEHPHHRVRLIRPFYLGTHEVTVADFRRFIKVTGHKTTAEKEGSAYGLNPEGGWELIAGLNWQKPGFEQQDTHAVTCVSWDDAVAFCEWLSREEGRTYRLPTEAEWEYACRAGTDTIFFWGDNADDGKGYLNGADETGTPDGRVWTCPFRFKDGYAATSPVGRFKPNAFGLCDMLGNVWEWCSDRYGSGYYGESPLDDPAGPTAGSDRVNRGGGWYSVAGLSRSASRSSVASGYRCSSLGFRVAVDASSK